VWNIEKGGYAMKIVRLVVLLLTAALFAVPSESQDASSNTVGSLADVGSDAQHGEPDVSDPEAFRGVLLRSTETIEAALGLEPRASDAIRRLGKEELKLWESLIPDLDRLVHAADEVEDWITEATSRTALAPGQPKLAQAEGYGMYDPDYPPTASDPAAASPGYYHNVMWYLQVLRLVPWGG
jgi:hypothetical protein